MNNILSLCIIIIIILNNLLESTSLFASILKAWLQSIVNDFHQSSCSVYKSTVQDCPVLMGKTLTCSGVSRNHRFSSQQESVEG